MLLPDVATLSESPLREAVRQSYRADEQVHVAMLADQASFAGDARGRVRASALGLVQHVRAQRREVGGIDALMQHYDLSSQEGVTLMCLAEALLRIPDAATMDDLIEDKLGSADWAVHLGQSESFFVNASTFGLMMAGRTVSVGEGGGAALSTLVKRLGEPVIREAVRRAMRVLGHQFVMGRDIIEAVRRAQPLTARGYRFSYDMLGEAARTMADADRYFDAYFTAITALGADVGPNSAVAASGVSVKLSALHPRFEFSQRDRVNSELKGRLVDLCRHAADVGIGLCVDAEEADRLDLSLDLLESVAMDKVTRGWEGLGFAAQTYLKSAYALVDWLTDLGHRSGRRLLVRLVKGAYWDAEIKHGQEGGFVDYPVFTRKANTDVSYLACAKKLLAAPRAFYPSFATHNADTLAALLEMIGDRTDLEFQRLHGMGEALFEQAVERGSREVTCRVYAPVGSHEDLLAYLVRRLLENGSNSSFVNRIVDDALPLAELVCDPVDVARAAGFSRHPRIPLPADLFGTQRMNSRGIDLRDAGEVATLDQLMTAADLEDWRAAPVIAGEARAGAGRVAEAHVVLSPANRDHRVGEVVVASAADALDALAAASVAHWSWSNTPVARRAEILRQAADLVEVHAPRLMTLIVREAGRCVQDAHLEIREAVDFLRYYALEAERRFAAPEKLPGPTGEENTLALTGRGPFLCIAPWNFPVAIFTGQIAAALAAGCPALAKPAEQTPLVGAEVIRLLLQAGVPADVLHFLPGDGPLLGQALLGDERLAGVAFTGSTQTARIINQQLAARQGPIIPLIAETGGINAMIVDSTALPEQVTRDVLSSAFQSAGQRCSALRLLCVQADVAEKHLAMIAGAMAELRLGDPGLLSTDVGPIIDESALAGLVEHKKAMAARFATIAQTPRGEAGQAGLFFEPIAFELNEPEDLTAEVFGPILHVVRFEADALDALVERINGLGYGLTLSVHSRSDSRIERIVARAEVGNVYVNRNQIGAAVGVQPFGGEGLSGTGPKAGGPNYLLRFAKERTLTRDTTASGGNASLMTLDED